MLNFSPINKANLVCEYINQLLNILINKKSPCRLRDMGMNFALVPIRTHGES